MIDPMRKEKKPPLPEQWPALYGVWARQLQREFAHICFQHALDLLPPVVEISESETVFGSWRAIERTIGISRHLILNHSWDVTVNVFKHEMAHQICHEVFRLQGKPHDRDFRRACDMLGLPERYCRAGIDRAGLAAEAQDAAGGPDGRGRLIEKIRKLLALSTSANEHEAQAALQMAVRIMDRHRLEAIDIAEEGNEAIYRILPTGKKRVAAYQRLITSLLSQYFQVTVIHSQLYDPVADQVKRTFEIFGRRDHVEIAEHCYHFLEQRLLSLWQTYQKNLAGSGRHSKNSYYLGILHGFQENLRGQRRKAKTGGKAGTAGAEAVAASLPARQTDKAVEECLRRRYPRLQKKKNKGSRVSLPVFNQGVMAGREITLDTAIPRENTGDRPKLLA